jgi:aspartokinase/homoserine dehydrogenase 1
MATLVMKFGGTSVGSAEAMAQCVEIVKNASQKWSRLVVVTSALSGITDLLLNTANRAAAGDSSPIDQAAWQILGRHAQILSSLLHDPAKQRPVQAEIEALVDHFASLCKAVGVLGEATPRALDAVASLGERLSVRVLSAALSAAGLAAEAVEANQLIVTDETFQAAHPDFEATTSATRSVLEPLLASGKVPVVTGFMGGTRKGIITTLGRGGSDYTAAILAAALPADEVWIWTDVNGVMTADPRLVPEACTIDELSYREVAELAYFGAKVLHPLTIRPVIEAGIGLKVLNTFEPEHAGTRIVADSSVIDGKVIKAVTMIKELRLVTLEGRGMLGVPGVAARTFGAIASTHTSVPLISQASSEQSICFAVPSGAAPQVVSAILAEFKGEIARRDIDRVWASDEVVCISVVGAGMIHTHGIAGRVFSTLGNNRVNVVAIAQGSSEVSISFIVDAKDGLQAVRALHALI